ncbi:site-specific integrase [Bosea sp. MMO-172]|uniref:site-specific integrase n=1 Tax=Bosea sp. MMO-172 TaxID=3127885 RepID=UPI0030176CB8
MATIILRKRADGTIGYQAQILISRDGKKPHRETKTFDREQAAKTWAKRREKALKLPGALEQVRAKDPKLAEVVDQYIREYERAMGRTKAQVLRAIKSMPMAEMRCSEIRSADYVSMAQSLDVKPQTRANYMSHLGSIVAIARPMWSYPLDQQAMKDAFVVCNRMGITGKSKARDRRPTLAELDKIMQHYGDRKARRPAMMPMQKIVAFAIFSTRRQEEICRIKWADLDEAGARILVRDMKNPGEKIGNNVWCDLPPEALAIIKSMPKVGDRIFPYSSGAISANFTRATAFLDFPDLTFHDLRHEGVSRLFEVGVSIPRAAAVSGHRSWQSMKRYTHIRQTGDKFEDWKWLATVTGS